MSPCSAPSFLSFGSKGVNRASFSCTLEVGPEGKGLEKVLEKAQAFFSGAKASSENYTAKAPLLQGLLTHQ